MYIPKSPEPIYNVINFPEDIEGALNDREQDKQKVSDIIGRNFIDDISQTSYDHYLGNFFKKTYCKSLGFTTCLEVVKGMDSYQGLLRRSITVYDDILTPLFIRSFKCHQTALHCFMSGQQEDAIAAMAETGKLAEKIASECQNLCKEFHLLRDEEVKVLVALTKDQVQVYSKKRELSKKRKMSGSIAVDRLKPILKAGISSLDEAINPMYKITCALLHVSTFWRQTAHQCENLANPYLADPDMVDLMGSSGSRNVKQELLELEKLTTKAIKANRGLQALKALNQLVSEKITFFDVAKSMKTGRTITAPFDREEYHLKKYYRIVENELTDGIEQEFENSYLKWIALAKVNHAIIAAAKEALVEVEEVRNDVFQLESDPLVVALHAHALNP